MNQPFDVIVLGGGIVGLTAALAMAQRHYTVALMDAGALKANTSTQDSRVYAINKASQQLLDQLKVWQHVDEGRKAPYEKMHVWDGVNGAFIDFNSRSIAAQNLGFIMEESVLKQALLQQIATQEHISLFPESSIKDIQDLKEGIRVESQDRTWDGQLLMIADGANSATRQKLRVPLTTWPYDQKAIVATVNTEQAHQKTAYQVFHPEGPLAFLPLTQAHQCSIVWSVQTKPAQALMELDEEAFNAQLTQAFANRLGRVSLASPRYQFPLHMRHVKQYSGSHWILLGDAAHTIHPLAGLGLNIGLSDVHSWMQCLAAANGALSSRKALGAYQRQRKHAVWQTILLMDGLKHLFGSSFPPLSTLRALGLGLCNEMTFLKRLFIQYAG